LADFLRFGFNKCLFRTFVLTRLKRFGIGCKINCDFEIELFERLRFNFFGFSDFFSFVDLTDIFDLIDLMDLSDLIDLFEKFYLRAFDFDLDLENNSGPVINPSTSCFILL
jgi:hypothetical protein